MQIEKNEQEEEKACCCDSRNQLLGPIEHRQKLEKKRHGGKKA